MENIIENIEKNSLSENVIKKYNLFVLLPNLLEDEIEAINQEIIEIISKVDGELLEVHKMGKRKLSYVVKKIRYGMYMNYVINLATHKNADLIRELKLKTGILRFELSHFQDGIKIINQEAVDEKGQIKMNNKQLEKKDEERNQNILEKKEKKVEVVDEKEIENKQVEKKNKKQKISTAALNEKLDDILNNDVEV